MNVLLDADLVVNGERAKYYGDPLGNHGCIAAMMSAYLTRKYGVPVAFDASDSAMFNILQKISREAFRPKRDNLVDIAGYTAILERVSAANQK